jgi:hypothetical protein
MPCGIALLSPKLFATVLAGPFTGTLAENSRNKGTSWEFATRVRAELMASIAVMAIERKRTLEVGI